MILAVYMVKDPDKLGMGQAADALAPYVARTSEAMVLTTYHKNIPVVYVQNRISLIVRFMGPTWGPPGADRTQVGPMLVP